jgi:hypothetical protein
MIIDNRYCLQTIVFKIKLYSKHKPLYFTWIDMLLVKGPLCSKQIGTFCSKDMLWVEASLLHGTDREICWIHVLLVKGSLFHGSERNCWIVTLQKGTKREFCSTDMLWAEASERNVKSVD